MACYMNNHLDAKNHYRLQPPDAKTDAQRKILDGEVELIEQLRESRRCHVSTHLYNASLTRFRIAFINRHFLHPGASTILMMHLSA